jgi:protein-disulfide isomerase
VHLRSAARLVGLALALASAGPGCSRPAETPGVVPPAPPAAAAQAEPPCPALAQRLCQRFGSGTDVCALVRRQAARFREERCTEMLGRFDQVVTELEELKSAAQVLASADQGGDGRVPAFGPADAKVTVVEFSDFDCFECGRASPLARAIRNLYGARVRFVFRQFPLAKHPHARLAAEASLAAHAQGKFWEYHDVLFANPQDLSRPALERYAREVGLDLRAFRRALDQGRYTADVDRDLALGRKLFLSGAPAVLVNGKRVEVPYGVEELSELLGAPAP